MAWYDLFSRLYDQSLEGLYRPYREKAFAELVISEGAVVLDLACGTAQNIGVLDARLYAAGATYVGVEPSAGMLRQARARDAQCTRKFIQGYIADITSDKLRAESGKPLADILLCTLGLTVIPNWESAFSAAFDLVRPGGTVIVMDVHAEKRDFQTWMVERIARADLSRQVWLPLEACATEFERHDTGAPTSKMGGNLFFATGQKPA